MRTIISAPAIFDGWTLHHNASLLIENHRILEIADNIEDTDAIHQSFSEGILVPGFIDLQVNGGGGVLFNNETTQEGLTTILKAHYQLGTHALLPTLITPEDTLLRKAITVISDGIENNIPGLLGLHLEGPMINPQRRGIHTEAFIHLLSDQIINRLTQGDLGTILITLAPECVSTTLIQELTDAGIIIFAGHTMADMETLLAAQEHGLKGFTHLYNAMAPMESRAPGTVGTALNMDQAWCTLINDEIHVHPYMVNIALRTKPLTKMILVTDAMATIGSDITSFQFNGTTIYRDKNRLTNYEGKLAGAHVTLFDAVLNTIKHNLSFEQAIQMVTLNPAQCLGIHQYYGHLRQGAYACINHICNNKIIPVSL